MGTVTFPVPLAAGALWARRGERLDAEEPRGPGSDVGTHNFTR